MSKVPVQKGKIVADQKTSKTLSQKERDAEAVLQNKMLRDGQRLKPNVKK